MSGHSKFANIKHKKEKADSTRGKIFTKLGREISVAVKEGGADANSNFKLRDVINKAKSLNMPNDTIDRSIKKASGELGAINYEEIFYEGYGPRGVAIIVKTLTDNRHRTAPNVRHAFTKGDGSIGTIGCVSYMFDKKGIVIVSKENTDTSIDDLMNMLLDSIEDIIEENEIFEISTLPENLNETVKTLVDNNINYEIAEIDYIPQNQVSLNEQELLKLRKILNLLEDDDDVQEVYHNCSNA